MIVAVKLVGSKSNELKCFEGVETVGISTAGSLTLAYPDRGVTQFVKGSWKHYYVIRNEDEKKMAPFERISGFKVYYGAGPDSHSVVPRADQIRVEGKAVNFYHNDVQVSSFFQEHVFRIQPITSLVVE